MRSLADHADTAVSHWTCGGYTGSLGHEDTDAKSFVDWGFGETESGSRDSFSLSRTWRKFARFVLSRMGQCLRMACAAGWPQTL